MTGTPTIRVATTSDRPLLECMLRALDELHVSLSPDVFRTHEGPARSHEWMTKAVEDAHCDILIANSQDGFVSVAEAVPPNLPMFRPDPWLSIDNLYVVPTCRRRGIGRALMSAAYDWGRARGLTRARLGVWHNNREARAFYESLGYQELKATLEAAIPAADGRSL